ARRGTRTPERLADAVVAAAVADRRGLARRVRRKDHTAVVMVAAQVAEIDVQRVDARLARLRERLERDERVADRRNVRQAFARAREHVARRTVERGQGDERVTPGRRQL